MNTTPISPRQQEALEFIRKFIAENGFSPASRDLAVGMGLSQSGAVQKIKALIRLGYIRTTPGIARSIALV